MASEIEALLLFDKDLQIDYKLSGGTGLMHQCRFSHELKIKSAATATENAQEEKEKVKDIEAEARIKSYRLCNQYDYTWLEVCWFKGVEYHREVNNIERYFNCAIEYPSLYRCFFGVSFILVLGLGAYFISNVYMKWILTPMIIGLDPEQSQVKDYPFPAVTICNMNQARLSFVKNISRFALGFQLFGNTMMPACEFS